MDQSTLGERISAERRKARLSQRQLGDKLSVSDKTVSKWENDGSLPDISTITALSEIFGCSVVYLMTGKEEASEEKNSDEGAPPKKRRKWLIALALSCALLVISFVVLLTLYLTLSASNFQGIYINVDNSNDYYVVHNTTYNHYFVDGAGNSSLVDSGSWFGLGGEVSLGDGATLTLANGSSALQAGNASFVRVAESNGQKDTIDVTFVTDEGQKLYTVKRGSTVPAPLAPTREGYAFLSWISEEEDGEKPLVFHDKDLQWRSVRYRATFACVHIWENDFHCVDAECLRCGEIRPASINHVYADSHTCHERTCLKCGGVSPATTDHSFAAVLREQPTCTEQGETQEVCTGCGLVVRTVIPAKGHIPSDDIVDKEATCAEEGAQHVECTVCGAVLQRDSIPKKEHTVVVDPADPATCLSTGWTEGSHCSVCGTVIVEPIYLDFLEHQPSDWITDVEATCEEPDRENPDAGIGHRHTECQLCHSVVDEEDIPRLDHTPVVIPASEPTCTEYGKTEGVKCSVCGKVLTAQTRTDAPLGHDYDEDGVCARCGEAWVGK